MGIAELLSDYGHDLLVALTQQGIRQISLSLLQISEAIALCHGGAAEAAELRQDEPDPVAALAACTQFGECAVVGGGGAVGLGTVEEEECGQ